MEFKDYYKTLGVERNASDEAIKKAFRKLARQHHPDVAKDKTTAEARFKEINEAYEVLGDPEKRRRYDTLGANWKHGQQFRPPPGFEGPRGRGFRTDGGQAFEFEFGGTGFSDFFERFFGGGHFGEGGPFGAGGEGEVFRGARASRRGADIEGDLLVTLHEAVNGAERVISMERRDPAAGKAGKHSLRVRIPAGVRDGQRIRVAGRGGAGHDGGEPGDLFLIVRLARHPDFRVKGGHLYHDLDLAPWEAVLGCTLAIPTLESPVSVRIPPGTVSGQQLRIRGRGLPTGPKGARGDLFVVVSISVPKQIGEEERKLWEQLAAKSAFDPRK